MIKEQLKDNKDYLLEHQKTQKEEDTLNGFLWTMGRQNTSKRGVFQKNYGKNMNKDSLRMPRSIATIALITEKKNYWTQKEPGEEY